MPDPDPQRDEAIPERQPNQKPARHPTPLSLLERARAHDAEAWRQLEKLYRPLVLFWCRRGGVNDQDAEDLTQEVLAAASVNLTGFRRDRPGDTFRGWLRVITKNQILLYRRKKGRNPPAVGGSEALGRLQEIADPQANDPLAGCEEEEKTEFGRVRHRLMEQVRGEFEDRTWQAFWLTVVEGRTPPASPNTSA